jgi:hypothetical protein
MHPKIIKISNLARSHFSFTLKVLLTKYKKIFKPMYIASEIVKILDF